jgi:hypothetical protein
MMKMRKQQKSEPRLLGWNDAIPLGLGRRWRLALGFGRPYGTLFRFSRVPTVETVGYFRASLWDLGRWWINGSMDQWINGLMD